MITQNMYKAKFLRHHFPLYIFCAIINVIILRVLSFVLSFNVIIFHGQQMLSFSLEHILCYHLCYHLMLSFIVIISPSFFPENVTHSAYHHLVVSFRM
jgi:hypothetical protein